MKIKNRNERKNVESIKDFGIDVKKCHAMIDKNVIKMDERSHSVFKFKTPHFRYPYINF